MPGSSIARTWRPWIPCSGGCNPRVARAARALLPDRCLPARSRQRIVGVVCSVTRSGSTLDAPSPVDSAALRQRDTAPLAGFAPRADACGWPRPVVRHPSTNRRVRRLRLGRSTSMARLRPRSWSPQRCSPHLTKAGVIVTVLDGAVECWRAASARSVLPWMIPCSDVDPESGVIGVHRSARALSSRNCSRAQWGTMFSLATGPRASWVV